MGSGVGTGVGLGVGSGVGTGAGVGAAPDVKVVVVVVVGGSICSPPTGGGVVGITTLLQSKHVAQTAQPHLMNQGWPFDTHKSRHWFMTREVVVLVGWGWSGGIVVLGVLVVLVDVVQISNSTTDILLKRLANSGQ